MKGKHFTFLLITILSVSTPAFAQTLVIFKNARSIEVDSVRYENNQCIYTKNGSERSVSLDLIEEIYVVNQGRIYPPQHREPQYRELQHREPQQGEPQQGEPQQGKPAESLITKIINKIKETFKRNKRKKKSEDNTSSRDKVEQLTLDEVCSLVPCRKPFNLTLRFDAERYVEVPLPKAPYYFNGVASIAAGETLYLEAVVQDGKLVKLDYVPEIKNPSTTLTFHFAQGGEKRTDVAMLLTAHNPLRYAVVYEAGIHPASADRFIGTSTCPILPGKSAFEHWPSPIIQIALTNFFLTSEAEALARGCR